jgi:hypothetical protein
MAFLSFHHHGVLSDMLADVRLSVSNILAFLSGLFFFAIFEP